jgi:hypothetical protein
MPEWLGESFHTGADVPLRLLIVRLLMALVLGCVVAGVYRLSRREGDSAPAVLMTTLVLLAVLIAMVTQVIGNSVARAFSLVGALSIVRFRTVVEDTRDTAFVIFSVVVGMAVGAGFLSVALIGIPAVTLAAFVIWPGTSPAPAPREDLLLNVRLGLGRDHERLLNEVLAKRCVRSRLVATATARQGAALDLTYRLGLKEGEGLVVLVTELNGLEGVQGVELRQA